jgi:hypothetical protein
VTAACSSPEAAPPPDGGGGAQDGPTTGCLTCGSDVAQDLPPAVAVRAEIDQVCSSNDNCLGSGVEGLSLSTGNEFTQLINVPSVEMPSLKRVLPGDPDHSYVYRKVACEGGIVQSCMPPGALPDPRLKRIFREWIEAGAPTD